MANGESGKLNEYVAAAAVPARPKQSMAAPMEAINFLMFFPHFLISFFSTTISPPGGRDVALLRQFVISLENDLNSLFLLLSRRCVCGKLSHHDYRIPSSRKKETVIYQGGFFYPSWFINPQPP
jgi:hypothetical protein